MKETLATCLIGWLAFAGCLMARLPEGFAEQHRDRLEALVMALDNEDASTAHIVRDWQSGNIQQATEALAVYAQQLNLDTKLLGKPHLPDDPVAEAEKILLSSFRLLGESHKVPASREGLLDWDYRGQQGDKEVAWMLNRHTFLPVLADAYARTGDPRYRQRLNQLWQDWILSNPYPDRLTFSAQWRPLEAARRVLNSWIHLLSLKDQTLDPSTRVLALASLLEHADALHEHASFWGGNHLITEKTGLLALALAFPGLKDSRTWRDHAVRSVTSELLKQTYPDGSYKELSNHYQRVVLVNTLTFLRLLKSEDSQNRDSRFYQRVGKMWDFFAGSMRPDGTGPMNNASDLDKNADYLLPAARALGRTDWLAMATQGRKGALPSGSASRFYPWAGQVFIRDNWSSKGDWVYFDAGPYGSAHQHEDRLHLSVTLGGRNLLVDNGRYSYQPGPWRDYFKSAGAHSVLLLDGQPAEQAPKAVGEPLAVSFLQTEEAAFCGAGARFPAKPGTLRSPVPWTRSVIYDRRGFVIVFDHLVAFSEHTVYARWQFDPQVTPWQAGRIVRVATPEPAGEPVIVAGQTQPDIRGFHGPDYNIKTPAPQAEFAFRIDRPTTIIHIIQEPEAEPVTVKTVSGHEKATIDFTIRNGNSILSEGSLTLYPNPQLVSYRPH